MINVATLALTLWLTLVVHELGHMVAGWLLGFHFRWLAVGPLRLVAECGRIRVRWNNPLPMWGGAVFMVPAGGTRLAARLMVYAAGGPLMSLLVAVAACWTGVWLLPGTDGGRMAILVALMSGGTFVATAQPFGTGIGVPSDGGRVLMFIRRRAEAEARAAELAREVRGAQGGGEAAAADRHRCRAAGKPGDSSSAST
jgi:hypothetical protein